MQFSFIIHWKLGSISEVLSPWVLEDVGREAETFTGDSKWLKKLLKENSDTSPFNQCPSNPGDEILKSEFVGLITGVDG